MIYQINSYKDVPDGHQAIWRCDGLDGLGNIIYTLLVLKLNMTSAPLPHEIIFRKSITIDMKDKMNELMCDAKRVF